MATLNIYLIQFLNFGRTDSKQTKQLVETHHRLAPEGGLGLTTKATYRGWTSGALDKVRSTSVRQVCVDPGQPMAARAQPVVAFAGRVCYNSRLLSVGLCLLENISRVFQHYNALAFNKINNFHININKKCCCG